jgi:hypothetical protein
MRIWMEAFHWNPKGEVEDVERNSLVLDAHNLLAIL